MRPRAKNTEKILSGTLGLFDKAANAEAESARAQTLTYLESHTGEVVQERAWDSDVVRPDQGPKWLTVAVIVAAMVLAVLIPVIRFHRAPAVFADATGSRRIQFGEVVRANDSAGSTLVLADTSRVEMRANSELSLERADDGVRIWLRDGDIIVNAAKQHGHLYVQTKDVTVSVIGTVFLVKAEAGGSRVAVIEGEVHVQQGATETKLHPGEQVSTNPKMESLSVKQGVAWSSQAVTHMASLEQAATTPAAKGPRFDVASVRPSAPPAPPAPGARGGGRPGPIRGCVPGSSGYSQQLDPRRLAITKATLFQLIGYAYSVPGVPDTIWRQYPGPDSCLLLDKLGLLPGGPEWVRTDMWDLEAAIPEGSFSIRPKLTDPKLQQMLQTLLEERFKVVIRHETREMPVYLLKVGGNGAKFNGPRNVSQPTPLRPDQKPRLLIGAGPDGNTTRTVQSPDGTFAGGLPGNVTTAVQGTSSSQAGTIAGGPPTRDGVSKLDATRISISDWVNHLFANLGRPVIDRTGLMGRYDFHFDFQGPSSVDLRDDPAQFDHLPESVDREAVKAMGFELEESRAPLEVWVIERAEKPSEN